MATNTIKNQHPQRQPSIKDYTEQLSSKEIKFTTDAETLLIKLKSAIDIDTDVEELNMCFFRLMQIYKSLETLTGELYLIALSTRGRVSYLQKDKNRTGGK